MAELQGILFISVITFGLIVSIEVFWRLVGVRIGLSHEVTRKAHHIGIGLIATCMPSFVRSPFSGLALALGFGSLLLLAYKIGCLNSFYSDKSVDRKAKIYRHYAHSWIGPAAYSIAVALVALFFWDELEIYRASLLILTLGDSAATAVGSAFGSEYYFVFGTRRSLEGNMALLVLASFICGATLQTGRLPVEGLAVDLVGVAVLFGFLLCLTETISPFGLDNLTLPLMTAVVMLSLRDDAGGYHLTGELVASFALVGLTALLLTRVHLNAQSMDGAALALGVSIVVLVELGRYLFVAILFIFLACTLLAQTLAQSQSFGRLSGQGLEASGIPDRVVGLGILGQVIPCLFFMALNQAYPGSGMEVGSLACVILLSARCYPIPLVETPSNAVGSSESGGESSSPSSRVRQIASQTLIGTAASIVIFVGATLLAFRLGMTLRTKIWLEVGLAATVGGWICGPPRRRPEYRESLGESLVVQFVPGIVLVALVPLLTGVILGIIGKGWSSL